MYKILSVLTFTLYSFLSFAQKENAEECKDHPMLSRMPGYTIWECKEVYTATEFAINVNNFVSQEGNLTRIVYSFDQESQKKISSWLQISKNYENALIRLGGKKVFSDDSYATFRAKKDNKELWIGIRLTGGGDLDVSEFTLDIVEKEPMKQEITANGILSALSVDGHIALYINFETGKADIKPDSQGVIEQLSEMLSTNPELKISIEGHTDNVGNPAANQILSTNRAKSVVKALVAKGISASRLIPKGLGQTKPIADNKTEEGRAQNRRVEIVKL